MRLIQVHHFLGFLIHMLIVATVQCLLVFQGRDSATDVFVDGLLENRALQ